VGVEALEDRWMPSAATITVDAAANAHPISPDIYGVNFGDTGGLADMGATVNRYGGNTASTYNWQENASNHAIDFNFQSISDGSATPGELVDNFISSSRAGGATPVITIPTMDFVAHLGPNRSDTTVANDGLDGAYVANSPQFEQGLVDNIQNQPGNDGTRFYALDNEPGLWNSTHSDTHSQPATTDEVAQKMIAYGDMIRANDPTAQILGPEDWNYSALFESAAGEPSNVPNILATLQAHEQATGSRVLDYLSMHYYPQADGNDNATINRLWEGGAVDPATEQLRNQATRSLWDPGYTDQSWVGFGGDPNIDPNPQLIPRVKALAAADGLKTALTEYSFGPDGHMSGATAEADVLGIFGREGLDMAMRWEAPAAGTPTYNAFKMYRNYDGQHNTFGDTSVQTNAASPDDVSAFGALRSVDGALTVMVVNKDLVDPADPTATDPITVNLSNYAAQGTVQFYLLSAADPNNLTTSQITRLDDGVVNGNSFTVSVPRQSVLLAVVAPQADGYRPPVNPPVKPPVNPPVTPPVNPPVKPPVNPPVNPPGKPPVVVPNSPVPGNLRQVAVGFTHSREHYTQFVTQAYQQYLNRTPDAPGLSAWVNAMMVGGLTDERLEAGFIGSPEYIANHGGAGRGWIVGMYQDLLGRTPGADEVQGWLNALDHGASEAGVAYGFAASAEREGIRVRDDYQTYLNRTASAAEVNGWVDAFLAGFTNEDVVAGFVGSPEYYNSLQKGKGNRADWLAMAYEQILGRNPSAAEVDAWLGVLA
jgi:hypothetical protein